MMLTIGAVCFGLVVGWVTYRTLRRSKTNGLSDIATIVGAVGGAAITTLFPAGKDVFGAYCIGLAVGFFGYLIVSGIIDVNATRKQRLKAVSKWLGGEPGGEPVKETEEDLRIAGN
jgi:uncharacterized membrane protein YeaQ/YmgE (transglycosylase-associated protein family)